MTAQTPRCVSVIDSQGLHEVMANKVSLTVSKKIDLYLLAVQGRVALPLFKTCSKYYSDLMGNGLVYFQKYKQIFRFHAHFMKFGGKLGHWSTKN